MDKSSKKKELAKNTLIIMVGQICTKFLSFFLLPLYTYVLDSSEFGIVDIVTTYVGLIVPCITLQLENGAFRFLVDVRGDENKKKSIITNVLNCAIILMCIGVFIYLAISLIVKIPYKYYIMMIVLMTIISGIVLQIARGLGDNVAYSVGSLIAGGCTIVFNVVFLVVIPLGPKGMFLSIIIANALCALFVFVKCGLIRYIDFTFIDKKETFDILRYSIPLVPNSVIWWIVNASDRTIIALFLSTSANGIYAVAYKFSNAVMSAYFVFNMTWTESTSLYLKDGDKDHFIADTFITMIKLFSGVCLGIIGCMSFVFPIMVRGDKYSDAYNYIPILMIGCVFNIIVALIGAIYVALKKTKEIALTSLWSGIINVVVNLIFVRYIGLYAAAISTTVAFGVMLVYRYIDVQKYIKLAFPKMDGFIIVSAFVISTVLYYLNSFIGNVVNLIFVAAIFLYMNRRKISSMINIK